MTEHATGRPAVGAADIDRAVLECLGEVAPDADPASLAPDQPFRDQIEFDSVDFLSFVLKLEKRFAVKVPEVDYPQFGTLDGARTYLRGLLGA